MNYKTIENKNEIIKKYYREKIKSKKKAGFTLIEIIAVIAIIGILAAAMLPNVNGYIKEAKKVKIVDQSRKVLIAVESYNLRHEPSIKEGVIVSTAISNKGVSKYLDGVQLDNLNIREASLKNCYDIVNGAEFDFVKDTEMLDPLTITLNSNSK